MAHNLRMTPTWHVIRDYTLILVGSLLVAANVPLFLEPNRVVPTGATGVAMLAYFLWGWPIGLVTFLLNVPLILAGIKWCGGYRLLIRTVFSVVVMGVSIDLFQRILTPVQVDPLLYTLFGGVLDGVGIGLVLRGRGTTGGTDIVAQLVNRLRGLPFGQVLIVVNGIVLAGATLVVGWVPVLYALVVSFVSGRAVDLVLEGVGYARAALVITDHHEAVREAVFAKLGRGVTLLEARGGYTQKSRPALYIVVYRSQVMLLKDIIAGIDPSAFVVVTEAHEVLGEGFRPVGQES
jgi:uncharacterized membrane-anchored protein YitT (DUF2179 family)